ncbi:hypothetical protein [Cohnella soli]|uniref:Uncharacterized protein n=1 Tax=Cohnella soli TaxID=425005 RepID=A0ABW0HP75_9BACL
MYQMETDKLGNFIIASCKHCFKSVRLDCKDEAQVASWNEDLKEGIGSGVYIQCETTCPACEEDVRRAEDYYEKRDDAGYQLFQYDDDEF